MISILLRWKTFIQILILLIFSFSLIRIQAFAYLDETRPGTVFISHYKPIYFLLGTPDTKIELSLKAQLIEAIPLYFGYTQLMFWDVYKSSAPFRDLNYNPDIFYRLGNSTNLKTWIDFGFFEHESNGLDGENSRSWNRAYVRYTNEWSLAGSLQLNVTAQVWVPYATGENPDIAHYRGLGEFTIAISGFLGPMFERDDLILRFYLGGSTYLNPFQGGQELTFRCKSKERKFLPLFVAQVFHGYGEKLLDYRENRTGIRAGIGF